MNTEMPSGDFIRYAVLVDISRARDRAEEKHGPLSSNECFAYVVLGEECGEVARAILEHDREQIKSELEDTAQVCVAWLERYMQEDIAKRHES